MNGIISTSPSDSLQAPASDNDRYKALTTRELVRLFAGELRDLGIDPTQQEIRRLINDRANRQPSATTISTELKAIRDEADRKAEVLFNIPGLHEDFGQSVAEFLSNVIRTCTIHVERSYEAKLKLLAERENEISHRESLAQQTIEKSATALESFRLRLSDKESECASLKDQNAQIQKNLEQFTETAQQREKGFQNTIDNQAQVISQLRVRIDSINDDLNSTVAQNASRIQSMTEAFQLERQRLEENHEKTVKQIRDQHEKALDVFQTRLDLSSKSIDDAKNFLMVKIDEQKIAYSRELKIKDELIDSYSIRVDELRELLHARTMQANELDEKLRSAWRKIDELKNSNNQSGSFNVIDHFRTEFSKTTLPISDQDQALGVLELWFDQCKPLSLGKKVIFSERLIDFMVQNSKHYHLSFQSVLDGDIALTESSFEVEFDRENDEEY